MSSSFEVGIYWNEERRRSFRLCITSIFISMDSIPRWICFIRVALQIPVYLIILFLVCRKALFNTSFCTVSESQ